MRITAALMLVFVGGMLATAEPHPGSPLHGCPLWALTITGLIFAIVGGSMVQR